MDKVRIDKWLWSVRIFKTRTLASEECKSGHVKSNGQRLKPSASISIGDVINVEKNGFKLTFKVLKLIEKRVGAPIAVTCYEDLTPEEELKKYDDWFVGKRGVEIRERGAGRPTKRQRRELDKYKQDRF